MLTLAKHLTINSRHYLQILSYLNSAGGSSRLVGGCVRDSLLNKPNYDIDIATTLLPEQVISILSTKDHIKVVPTGLIFGTVSAFVGNECFEITTLRQDIDCDGRRAKVTFTTDFKEDAARRDFTINALSYCPFKQIIYDYFGGMQDIIDAKVRFIGDPSLRIKEDFLRILRFFRFSRDYAKHIDQDGFKACAALKYGLDNLSKERIKSEIDRLIEPINAPYMLQQMDDADILQCVFPWKWDYNSLARGNKFAKDINIFLSKNTKYSLLFHDQHLAKTQLIAFKCSKQDSNKIFNMTDLIQQSKSTLVDYMLKKIWQEYDDFLEYITIITATNIITPEVAKEFIAAHINLERPVFTITGDDLLEIGLHGKVIGDTLQKLKELWINSNFTMTKQQLMTIAKK